MGFGQLKIHWLMGKLNPIGIFNHTWWGRLESHIFIAIKTNGSKMTIDLTNLLNSNDSIPNYKLWSSSTKLMADVEISILSLFHFKYVRSMGLIMFQSNSKWRNRAILCQLPLGNSKSLKKLSFLRLLAMEFWVWQN